MVEVEHDVGVVRDRCGGRRVSGLATGVICDVRWACGYSEDPMAHWWDPFKINDGA